MELKHSDIATSLSKNDQKIAAMSQVEKMNEEKITRMSTVIANYQHQVTSVEQRCTDGNKINSLVSGGPAVYMNSVLETSSYDKKKGCKRASLFVAKTGDLSI